MKPIGCLPAGLYPPLATMPATTPSHSVAYFPAASHNDARQQLTSVVAHGGGIAILLGGVGVGKTFLLDVVANDLAAQELSLSSRRIVVGRCRNSDELLELVSSELGLKVAASATPSARRLKLRKAMESGATPQVLFLDEVDGFSPEMLDEVRAWSDWRRGEMPAVRCVLAGTHSFDETLTHPKLAAFSQRIAARCYLEPFLSNETRAFLNRTTSGEVWSDPATTLVHRLTEGVPRLVVQLAANVSSARTDSTTPILATEIQTAWQRIESICTKPQDSVDDASPVCSSVSFSDDADDINDDLAGAACVEFGADVVETESASDCVVAPSVVVADTATTPPPVAATPVPVPAYVYQTTEPVVPQYPCYIDKNIAMLNWVAPGHRITAGYATQYRASSTTSTASTMSAASTTPTASTMSIASIPSTVSTTSATSLDETFAESICVTSSELSSPVSSPVQSPLPAPVASVVSPSLPVQEPTRLLSVVIPPAREGDDAVCHRLETAIASLHEMIEQLHGSGGRMERVVEHAVERTAAVVEKSVAHLLDETIAPPIHELIEMIVDFEEELRSERSRRGNLACAEEPLVEGSLEVVSPSLAASPPRSVAEAITQFDGFLADDGRRECRPSAVFAPRSMGPARGKALPLTAPQSQGVRGQTSRGVSLRNAPAIRLFQDDPHRRVDHDVSVDSLFRPPH